MTKKKVLIIRFSSFGDIVQCMSVVILLNEKNVEIDFLTKKEFSNLVRLDTTINTVHEFDKKDGILGLVRLAIKLRSNEYDVIYDAHSNVRSFIVRSICALLGGPKVIVRSKERLKRIALFYFRKIYYENWPFRGMWSYVLPLKDYFQLNVLSNSFPQKARWTFPHLTNPWLDKINTEFLAIAPSAAWEMKRWPISHWRELLENDQGVQIVILGGPQDLFCQQLEAIDPKRILNVAGKLSLIESCYVVSRAKGLISADTGLVHVADILGVKALNLIGPTAFGYTSSQAVKTMEVNLSCRPCSKDGRGRCSQSTYQKCMVDIQPSKVLEESKNYF